MAKSSSGNKSGIRIVVAGDRATGKSSLIATAVSETFPTNVAPVLSPSRLPDDMFPDRVPITIIDTSSSIEQRNKVGEEMRHADAVLLTHACHRLEILDRLSTYWLPEFRQLEIPEVFYYAQKAVLRPTAPLSNQESQTLRPQCVRALKRIFISCDHDKDGSLSAAELNYFQVKCFNAPLQPSEIIGVKRVVEEKLPERVNVRCLTLRGFLFLHALFIEKGRLETTWTVLRRFGYNNEIRLDDEFLPPSFKRAPDQSVQLTTDAIEALNGIFSMYDNDNDGAIRPTDVDDLFFTAPDCPWGEGPYKDAAPTIALGGLTMDGFLLEWALMTLLEPAKSVEYLKYIMSGGDASSALLLTRRRCTDRNKRQSERNVYQCFVFGPRMAVKLALWDAFLGRPFSDCNGATTEDRYAANVVEGTLD